MKKVFVFLAIVFSFLAVTVSVAAGCGGQYESPCQSYSILVDKMVAKPGTSEYVDNLSVSDPRYKPSEFVLFKVTIKNTSTTTFGGMIAKDFVPAYLTPIEGPGTFDASTRTVSWDAGFFNVDEQKTYYFKMQINSQANLPANQGLFCLVNKVVASSNTTSDDDSSQFCIEKQVSTPPKVPSAGPEMGLALMAIQLAGVGAGIYLRKRA
ncbi:conserved exported hypothetical protein [Candidatus Roizmanbacteria bacterium]|nr:conserved exported hypothetical protein [Candidatus Roizmanbacteria bacterium]